MWHKMSEESSSDITKHIILQYQYSTNYLKTHLQSSNIYTESKIIFTTLCTIKYNIFNTMTNLI